MSNNTLLDNNQALAEFIKYVYKIEPDPRVADILAANITALVYEQRKNQNIMPGQVK